MELPPDASAKINKMKLRAKSEKNALSRGIDELERKVKEAETKRDNATNDQLNFWRWKRKQICSDGSI